MESGSHVSSNEATILTGAGIRLFVASGDAALISTCREVLHDLQLAHDESGVGGDITEIYLSDFESDRPIVRSEPNQKVFYVVHTSQVEELRARIPEAEGNILLKPVTRVVLRAFLGSTTRSPRSYSSPPGNQNEIGTLRADRDEMLQHLLRANLRLQEYDQQRTNFIARAVHDFRAPITALSGFCGLLTSGELGSLGEVQKEALDRMQRSIQRLSYMTSAMFDLSAGPRLGKALDLRAADIREPIHQAIHEIAPIAREKHIEVRADQIVPPPTLLHFEPSQIEQVLVNLLDNACRFVPKHGLIEVLGYPFFWDRRPLEGNRSLDRRGNRSQAANSYRIDVKDSGPGVPPELIEHIFEEYTSYSGSQDRSGGGLGLAICRFIIGRHQGHVWAEATADGSAFSFVLPLQQNAESPSGRSESGEQ